MPDVASAVVNTPEVGTNQQSEEVAEEMDCIDRILDSAVSPPPPPKQTTDPSAAVPHLSSQGELSAQQIVSEKLNAPTSDAEGEFFADFAGPTTATTTVGEDCKGPGSIASQLTAPTRTQQCIQRPTERSSRESPRQFASEHNPRNSTSSRRYSMEDVPADEMMSDRSDDANFTPTPIFPHSASPKVSARDNYNEQFPADLDLPSSRKGFHTPIGDPHGVNDIVEQEEEAYDSDQKVSSSIDAFEASFATTFPPSFSTAPRDESSAQPARSEIYNPFFHSPNKQPHSVKRVTSDSQSDDSRRKSIENSWGKTAQDGSAANSVVDSAAHRSSCALPKNHKFDVDRDTTQDRDVENNSLSTCDTVEQEISTEKEKVCVSVSSKSSSTSDISNRPSSASRSLFPESPMSTFEMYNEPSASCDRRKLNNENLDGDQFVTPPHFPVEQVQERTPGEQPRRPEKTGAAAARARYEKALQPRVFGGSSRAVGRLKDRKGNSSELEISVTPAVKSVADTTHSPSLVLKRLQQRRVKEKTSGSLGVPSGRSSSPQLGTVSGGVRITLHERHKRTAVGRPSHPSMDRDVFSPSDEEDVPPPKIRDATSSDNVAPSSGTTQRDSSQVSVGSGPVEIISSTKVNGYSGRSRIPGGCSSKSLSPESMNAEIRALDAIASGSYTPKESGGSDPQHASVSSLLPAAKNRRNVKQPVSYAEPPLNSKLRRGDVYFAKGDTSESRIAESPPVVSPTSSSPDEINGARTLPRPNNRQNVGSAEVLKDLGGVGAVRL